MRYLIKIFSLLFLLATLTACGIKIIPRDTQEGVVDQRAKSITIEKEGIRITVKSMKWRYSPSYLEDYYTPLYVIVRNGTDKGIELRHEDFLLFDDKGNQFRPIPPEKVKDSLFIKEPYSPYRAIPPYYWYWDYWWRPYWYTRPWPYPYYWDYVYPYDIYEGPLDVVPQALQEGEVLPNSQVRGFLYFQKATEFGKDLTLRVTISGLIYNFLFEIRG